MIELKERFVVDKDGNRVGVFLDIDVYNMLLEIIEEIESVRAYDAAKTSEEEAIPFEQAVAQIEEKHK